MAATLRDTLLAPEVQPRVVADCEALSPGADPDDHVTGALADAPAAADLPRPVGTGVPGEPRARSG